MATAKKPAKAASKLLGAKKSGPKVKVVAAGNVAQSPRLSDDQLTHFLLEIRDSYFTRLNIVSQSLSNMRIRTYQILAAEIIGFLAFLKLFSSIKSSTFKPTPYLNLGVYHALTWILVLVIFLGFFRALYLVWQIEMPRPWHGPALKFDANLAIANPLSVSELTQTYLSRLEEDVKTDEALMYGKLDLSYSKLMNFVTAQLVIMGGISGYLLLYLRLTRF